FAFKHALAKVGGSMIYTPDPGDGKKLGFMVVLDLDDQMGAEVGGKLKNEGEANQETKVTISDIKVEARTLVADENGNEPGSSTYEYTYLKVATGNFNLATGQWEILKDLNESDPSDKDNVVTDQTQVTPTTHEITTAGTDVAGKLNTTIAEPTTVATTEAGFTGLVEGVLTTPKNVYDTEAYPLVYIPETWPELTVTVEYVVRTKDSNLKNAYSEVKQRITKRVTFKDAVELNKQYSLLMHLGLTSVKFTASVSDWEIDNDDRNYDSNGDTEKDIEVTDIYVPINVGGKYSFTSYNGDEGPELATGVAELTGNTKGSGTDIYKEVKVLYNNPHPEQIGRIYYMKGSVADETTKYELFTESDGTFTGTGIFVTVSEFAGKTYSFTSYADESKSSPYYTGTARNTGNFKTINVDGTDKICQQIVVLTNGDNSWVGKTFYVSADAESNGDTAYRLYDNNGTAVDVWVTISE
ncbi:MAG: hypothetical protein IJT97_06875, partial [Bacteroidaceae bacterium]|nr:hypothetical protein [Bacteroidaceae bacterium]